MATTEASDPLDEVGNPVARATVEPFGFRKDGRGRFGGLKGYDPLAVTDDTGVFRLGIPEAGVELFVHVAAPFLAPRKFQRLPVDGKGHDLTLFRGVTVRGRLVKNGKPLAGGAIGLAQKDRNGETFVGPFQAASDGAGVFTIPNLPPDDSVLLYGLMESLRSHGAVAARELRTGTSGTEIDVGDVRVKPGYRLAGRVELGDSKAVPAGTRVLLSRQGAWDSQQAVVDKDGAFAFEGLPAEGYSLSVRVPGYHLSAENKSLDPLNPIRLLGGVRSEVQGLRLLFAPGPKPARSSAEDRDRRAAEYLRRQDAPLRGAPATPPKR
jgi:hypothetical protein